MRAAAMVRALASKVVSAAAAARQKGLALNRQRRAARCTALHVLRRAQLQALGLTSPRPLCAPCTSPLGAGMAGRRRQQRAPCVWRMPRRGSTAQELGLRLLIRCREYRRAGSSCTPVLTRRRAGQAAAAWAAAAASAGWTQRAGVAGGTASGGALEATRRPTAGGPRGRPRTAAAAPGRRAARSGPWAAPTVSARGGRSAGLRGLVYGSVCWRSSWCPPPLSGTACLKLRTMPPVLSTPQTVTEPERRAAPHVPHVRGLC